MRANAKLIISLIKRVEVRLPINNAGRTIEVLEQDSVTQQTVAAIIELSVHKLPIVTNQLALVLESISKNTQPSSQATGDMFIPHDVLQSQLFVLRLLSACLQHHWSWFQKQSVKASKEANKTEEAIAAAAATGIYATATSSRTGSPDSSTRTLPGKPALGHLKPDSQIDPPPLDDALVTFLLSLLNRFLNHMHIVEERSDQLASSSAEASNESLATIARIDPQTLEYIREIYNTTGKVLHYVSASNWPAYYAKIKNAVNILGAVNENLEINPPEIRILAFACLSIPKLHSILSDLSPYFLNMRIQGKLLFARMMRQAIWKWIETRPSQFAEVCASTSRPLAGSEILFDMCNVAAADDSRRKSILWPLQTILLTLSPDLLVQAFLNDNRTVLNRRTSFPRLLKKTLQSNRMQEIAAICCVDLCKAATFISPNEDSVLRHIAADIEDVLYEKVWDLSRPLVFENISASLGYTINYQALLNDYFMARLRLDPKKTLAVLVPPLSEEDTPIVFKQAFVNSCLTIITTEEYNLPWNPTLSPMYESICTPLRQIFLQIVRAEFSANPSRSDISNATSGSKKMTNTNLSLERRQLQQQQQQQQNSTALLQSLLKLFRIDPLCALLGNQDDAFRVEENGAVMSSMISLLRYPDRRVRNAAIDCLSQLHSAENVRHWGPSSTLTNNFWKISSQTIATMARQILDFRQNEELSKNLLELLSKILVSRNTFLRNIMEMSYESTDVGERSQSILSLEIVLLVSLCSPIPEICSTAVKCLGHLCTEIKLIDEDLIVDTASRGSQITTGFIDNIEIYEDLSYEEPVVHGMRKQTFVGRKAQQKRVRKYLRMINLPTPGVLGAWEEVWKRWKLLTQIVSRFGMEAPSSLNDIVTSPANSTSSVKKIGGLVRHEKLRSTPLPRITAPVPVGRIETDDEKQTEWQNYTGFLAALSGSRLAADIIEEDLAEDAGKRNKMNESRISSPIRTISMTEKFIAEMVGLLTSENVVIREGAKDTLGGDLSPSLYSILFRHLESTVANCFNANGEVMCDNKNTLLIEQSVLVLKMILDRLVDPNDCLLSVDFSTLIIHFVNYINRLPHENYNSLRIMIMFCHLTEVLMLKKEQIIIRDDVKIRNKLLEIIIEWTSGFALRVVIKDNAVIINSQNREVRRDLDQVCLKAMVALLHKLPLQATDQGREGDRSMTKNRLFQKYFTIFTQLLDYCHRLESEASSNTPLSPGMHSQISNNSQSSFMPKSSETYQYYGPLKENAVVAISNLLSANVDAGLKSALAMGYHEDARTRTAFMQVLSNILNQGAQFDTLAEDIAADRYEELVDMFAKEDVSLALCLCDVVPASDTQGVAEVLLQCFESRNKVFVLLEAIIDREVSNTEQEATLFRGTNMATKLLSVFTQETCSSYVRFTLQPALELINSLPDENLSWEMDPQKISPNESIAINRQNVCRATEILLNAICNSTSNVPKYFRQELALISEAVRKRFPDSVKTAIGGFVFLRLFNPAILTPENCGFPKTCLPRSKSVRKLLLQATRMMQNLANNVMFGSKETHLISLNDFITSNLYRVASFLRDISAISNSDNEAGRNMSMDDIAYMNLHRYIAENIDKISRLMYARCSKVQADTQTLLLAWKRDMDKISNLLAQLGPVADAAHNDFSTTRNYALVNSNNFYSGFMRRNKHRDVSYISSLNVFYQGGVSKVGRPVFCCIFRNIVGDNFDFELLIYYMLRVMEPCLSQPFELLLDASCLSEDNEIPLHWMNQFYQLIFNEMNDNLVMTHVFNPNFYWQKYVRKLPRVLTNRLVKRTRFSNKISDLAKHIALPEIRLPNDTYNIEKELGVVINNAHIISSFKAVVPVQVRIGPEYLVVTTLKEQEIFWSLNTVLNNVYSMTDICNIFLPPITPNKKTTNSGEIHIVTNSGKETMVLVVPNRDEVYRYLLECKKNFDTHNTETSDGIRPTDVPGRILNMALLNMGGEDPLLRSAAYNLLHSLCIFFRFSVDHKVMNARDLCIPYNSTDFIVSMSENLANSEAHLTLEFLNEAILGFNRSAKEPSRQILTLDYIKPWFKNLSLFVYAPSVREPTKVKEVIRSIIIMTAERSRVSGHIRDKIWCTLRDNDDLHNVILEEAVQFVIENGLGSSHSEAIVSALATLNTNNMRGKIIQCIRKALASTAQNVQNSIVRHQAWTEIGCWIRVMLMMMFYSTNKQKPLVAEVFHVIALTVSTGPTFIRSSVHELAVNLIHTLVTNLSISPDNRKKLKYVLDDVCDGKYRVHFGLNKSYATAFTINEDTMTDNMEHMDLSSLEVIVKLLLDTIQYAAPDMNTANAWRARWMSLVTSMAFQFNPALQPRAFVILGCLAQEEIDDDLLFQILVVLRNELARFDRSNPHLVVSILMCLTNILSNLSTSSRYLMPSFWLALGMSQINLPSIYNQGVKMLDTVIRTLDSQKCFENRTIQDVMLETRSRFGAMGPAVDQASGISFSTHFSFAAAGFLLKGYRHAEARDNVFSCLSTFLEIEAKSISNQSNQIDPRCLGYLCGLLPFAAKNDALIELLRLAGVTETGSHTQHPNQPKDISDLVWQSIDIPNDVVGVLTISFLINMLSYADNESERLFLYEILAKIAASTPEIFALVYDTLAPQMNSIVISSDNVTLLDAIKDILVTACSEKAFDMGDHSARHHLYLEQIGFKAFAELNFGSFGKDPAEDSRMLSEFIRIICE
ncbi:hypothetical protein EDC96DRAFT_502763 [Choanephora cucurbitarum]|nr:hypothetical protein EDC96DRAFT_502763 [Choanephora cucurbitarum]